MAILKIVEFLDPTGEIIVHREPAEGSGEFAVGTQLIVQESQIGVFFRDGKALDGFKPGRHTLSTENVPLLRRVLGAAFGGKSPFRAYVYFVATKTFTNLGWGTTSPVMFRDADLRMIRLRAHGAVSIRIVKPRIFLNTIVGTRGLQYTAQLEDFLRTIIVSRLNEALARTLKSILDLPAHYSEIAATVKKNTEEDFGQYGIQLVDLLVEAITPPVEVQKMMDRASGIAAQDDAQKYTQIAAADAMVKAADNPGGAGEGLGAGLGIGMGFAMAKEMASQVSGGDAQGAAPAGRQRIGPEELKAKLAQLKELLDEGLITQADFDEQKQKLLAQL